MLRFLSRQSKGWVGPLCGIFGQSYISPRSFQERPMPGDQCASQCLTYFKPTVLEGYYWCGLYGTSITNTYLHEQRAGFAETFPTYPEVATTFLKLELKLESLYRPTESSDNLPKFSILCPNWTHLYTVNLWEIHANWHIIACLSKTRR